MAMTFVERFGLVKDSLPVPLKPLVVEDVMMSINPNTGVFDLERATLYVVQCVGGPHEGKVGVIDYEKSDTFEKHNVFSSWDDYERRKGVLMRTSFAVTDKTGNSFCAAAMSLAVIGHFIQLTPSPDVTYELHMREKYGIPAWNAAIRYENVEEYPEEKAEEAKAVKRERDNTAKLEERATEQVSQMFTPLYKAHAKSAGHHKRVMAQKEKLGIKPPIDKGLLGTTPKSCKPKALDVSKVLKVAKAKAKIASQKRKRS